MLFMINLKQKFYGKYMETSKKQILFFFVVTILPYCSFWVYTDFAYSAVPYLLVPLFATVLIAMVVLKNEISSLHKLTEFAKGLKDGQWSSRIDGIETSGLSEVAEAFNMAADRFEHKQNELRQVIDLVPGFIYAKDIKGNITLANEAFAKFLDKAPREIVGKNEIGFEPMSFLRSSSFDEDIFEDNSLKSISEEEYTAHDKTFTYLVFRSPLLDKDGTKLAMLVFAYDITTLKEIQDNLQSLNISLEARVGEEVAKNVQKDKEIIKEKEKFIRNAVHEINTALTVITLNAEFLIREYGHNRSTSAILGAAKSLANAYGDLSYSTIKDSTTFQKESSVEVSELIIDRIEFFRDIAALSDITLASQIKPGAVFFINQAKLTRLIDNNLSNAIKYSHPQKTIFIRFMCDTDKWILEFESIGKKIEDKNKIFELFTREDGIKGGHGIGLSMVKEICDEQGIEIEVDTDGNKNVFRYRFNKNC
jgi:PAS domain S-box-containing protein